jgi:predicted GIY-YIG superfamily endonuclease
MWIVYEIWTKDGRVYVGCTSDLKGRMAKHKSEKKRFYLQRSLLKVVLKTRSQERALKKEARLIATYDSTALKNGYNRRHGGSQYGFPAYVDLSRDVAGEKNPMWGKSHSKETREKIRQRALSRDPSTFDSNRLKTRAQMKALQEARVKFQKNNPHPMLGKRHSAEAKRKMSESKRLKKLQSF